MELKKTIENLRKTEFGFFNLERVTVFYELTKPGLFIWDGNNIKTFTILTKKDSEIINILYNIEKWKWYYINKSSDFTFYCPYYKKYEWWCNLRRKKNITNSEIGIFNNVKSPFYIGTEFDTSERKNYRWKTL